MTTRPNTRVRSAVTRLLRGVALCGALAACGGSGSQAALLFTETFQYPVSSNLAGQNGGTGFSGAWSGGNSTIVTGLVSGSGSAVQVGASASSRQMSSTVSTSGTSTYLTYLMNASSLSGGNYTGLSLYNGGTEEMFMGIPWQTQKFGFDARSTTGTAGVIAVNFTPLTNTSYLIALGLLPSATSGKVDVKMWATSNLAIDPNTLVAGAPNAQLLGTRDNFSFSSIRLAGDYAGALKIAGVASSPNVSEAASVSVNAVPEPTTLGLIGVAALIGGLRAVRRTVRS